ncbi:hypothetical protein NPIL_429261 [Nephila pilipes]|uniref:Uncharacterized protein n=1 Tax=Nephila pilipes TaxID=299642 RepID=A0A8X6QD84_NEPPI|nr:hypothetical protein NPIL_429261 [Nephila pilipes]
MWFAGQALDIPAAEYDIASPITWFKSWFIECPVGRRLGSQSAAAVFSLNHFAPYEMRAGEAVLLWSAAPISVTLDSGSHTATSPGRARTGPRCSRRTPPSFLW